jgi:enoyl-CoA hydratase
MKYQNLLVEETNGIVKITINREKAMNALNYGTFTELEHFFGKDYAEKTDFKGVIITGAGEKAFVAGADIKEFLDMEPEKGEELSQRGQDIFFLIERFHRPVIAAVNGFALGGGCELAMACHLRIAGEKAKFGLPEASLGLIPGYGGTQRLVQYVGKAKALELIMTTDMIDANEAHRLGLANHVVPQGEEVAKATEILEKIGTKGPLAIEKAIEAVNAGFDPLQDGFIAESESFGDICHSADFREGATAFVEKRKANFTGK